MAKHTAWRKPRPGQDRNVFEICLAQRRQDTYGRRLRVFSLDELAGMSAAELAKVKAAGWLVLPDLITKHPPPCPCIDCETARAEWRERTDRE
jgi:hypothetical protein